MKLLYAVVLVVASVAAVGCVTARRDLILIPPVGETATVGVSGDILVATDRFPNGSSGSRREIKLMGVRGQSVEIESREFVAQGGRMLARPAFTERYTVDLSHGPETLTIKFYTITLLRVSGNDLTYRVDGDSRSAEY